MGPRPPAQHTAPQCMKDQDREQPDRRERSEAPRVRDQIRKECRKQACGGFYRHSGKDPGKAGKIFRKCRKARREAETSLQRAQICEKKKEIIRRGPGAAPQPPRAGSETMHPAAEIREAGRRLPGAGRKFAGSTTGPPQSPAGNERRSRAGEKVMNDQEARLRAEMRPYSRLRSTVHEIFRRSGERAPEGPADLRENQPQNIRTAESLKKLCRTTKRRRHGRKILKDGQTPGEHKKRLRTAKNAP